jgi:uncharacterized surface protein with fasciclin (FAS1) repeats
MLPAVVLALTVVNACGGATPAGSPTRSPTIRAQSGATSLSVDPDLDGKTHARLHVVLMDRQPMSAEVLVPNVDLYVNGKVAENGGQAQVNVPAGYITAYMYLKPGVYHVALAPAGEGLKHALIPAHDVQVAAGHRYLLAFMGEISKKSLKPLLIDETAAATQIGASPSDPVTITLNGVVDSTGLDYEWAGKLVNRDIKFGTFAAGINTAGQAHVRLTCRKGQTSKAIIDEDNYNGPVDVVFGAYGHDTENTGVVDSGPTSELTLTDFLQAPDPKKRLPGSQFPSFSTVLQAINKAGLTNTYNDATMLFLPPTDQAFAEMPKAERDALLADPAALARMLRAHTIAAYVPRGSLAQTPGGLFNRRFTNLLGDPIAIGNDYKINGTSIVGFDSVWLANGTQIHAVQVVTLPKP